MKKLLTSFAGLLSLAALVAALAIAPAQADTKAKVDPTKGKIDPTKGKVDVQLAVAKATLNAEAFRVLKRAAMQHKAIEMVDPKTKKKYGPNDMITTAGGKKVKASEYFAELNNLEKKLNAIGHTLRDADKKVVLVQTELKAADLEQKQKQISAGHLKFDAKIMRAVHKRETLAKEHAAAIKKDANRIEAIKKLGALKLDAPKVTPRAATPPKGTTKSWNWEMGRKKLVAAGLSAKLETSGNTDRVRVRGEARADGWLVNRKQNLVTATGVVTVPRSGQNTLNVSVSVLGRTVYNKNLSKTTAFTHKDELSKTFDKSVSFRFQLGPIPMSVKMGARGTVGIRYFVGIRPLSAEAQFIPFVRAEAYAQCGIDIVVAGAGVGGKLRLIDFELRIGGKLTVKFDNGSKPTLSEHAYVQSDLSMLSGSLYVYVNVNVLFWKKHYEWDLWKWKGLKVKGYLVNIHKTHNLF